MFYQNELRFLYHIFQKNRISASVISLYDLIDGSLPPTLHMNVSRDFAKGGALHALLCRMESKTVYRLTDSLRRSFLSLLLPGGDTPTVLLIGPFLSEAVDRGQLLAIGEKNGILPQELKGLSEYLTSLPVFAIDCPLRSVLHTFCELIWHTPSFSLVDADHPQGDSERPLHDTLQNHSAEDSLLTIKAMEQRYAFENQLMQAVAQGQLHMEQQLFSAFSATLFEKRTPDSLRNAKNYCVIMNTLLRKAAEQGGVHPIHLNRVSSEFALKIESMCSLSENTALMSEMFRSYCRLVRKHALQGYSPIVQRTLLLISSDLSADLSSKALADSQEISLGYLSALFRKEVGKTVSEYVREKRMEYAAHLLTTTDLQVQTVAMHCGIMDAQYFSKLFKRTYGTSPLAYREQPSQ